MYSALREPCARTYTVGASGAIVSDPADRNGLEHMCCFFAGENMLSIIDLERQEIIVSALDLFSIAVVVFYHRDLRLTSLELDILLLRIGKPKYENKT